MVTSMIHKKPSTDQWTAFTFIIAHPASKIKNPPKSLLFSAELKLSRVAAVSHVVGNIRDGRP